MIGWIEDESQDLDWEALKKIPVDPKNYHHIPSIQTAPQQTHWTEDIKWDKRGPDTPHDVWCAGRWWTHTEFMQRYYPRKFQLRDTRDDL